jgi:hypothetical protein
VRESALKTDGRLNMVMRIGSLIGLTVSIACFLAAPALATPHPGPGGGPGKPATSKHVLLGNNGHDNGLHLGQLPWSIRFDLREFLRQQRENRHAMLMAWLRSHRKPAPTGGTSPGGNEGGGVVLPPVGTPSGGTEVPMPEPGAALLFALGTGMVALYLKRPQTA